MKEIVCKNKETGVIFILTEEQYEELKHIMEIVEDK